MQTRLTLLLSAVLLAGICPAQENKTPYTLSLTSQSTSLMPGQTLEVEVTLANTGDETGPAIARSSLLGTKSFLGATTRARDESEEWRGEYLEPTSKAPSSKICPLLPGEKFVASATLKVPESFFTDPLPFHVEIMVPSGPLKGVRSNQLMIRPINPTGPVATVKTSMGKIVLELWPDQAPNHVANFITLAKAGAYKDKIFHRVIPGFMVQTGCPEGTGRGGPGYSIKAEFNDRPFKKGVLGMARSQSEDSGGCQFFVMVGDAPHLNNKYTAFGQVLEGQDVADAIAAVRRNSGDRPVEPVALEDIEIVLPKAYKLPEVQKIER